MEAVFQIIAMVSCGMGEVKGEHQRLLTVQFKQGERMNSRASPAHTRKCQGNFTGESH